MALRDKYAELIRLSESGSVQELSIIEKNNVLYVSGKALPSVKKALWDIYEKIDPDMRAGDLILKIDEIEGVEPEEEIYEVKSGDSLSRIAKKYPNMTWQKIYEANKHHVSDPDKIYVGQKLIIPLQ